MSCDMFFCPSQSRETYKDGSDTEQDGRTLSDYNIQKDALSSQPRGREGGRGRERERRGMSRYKFFYNSILALS